MLLFRSIRIGKAEGVCSRVIDVSDLRFRQDVFASDVVGQSFDQKTESPLYGKDLARGFAVAFALRLSGFSNGTQYEAAVSLLQIV